MAKSSANLGGKRRRANRTSVLWAAGVGARPQRCQRGREGDPGELEAAKVGTGAPHPALDLAGHLTCEARSTRHAKKANSYQFNSIFECEWGREWGSCGRGQPIGWFGRVHWFSSLQIPSSVCVRAPALEFMCAWRLAAADFELPALDAQLARHGDWHSAVEAARQGEAEV